MERAREIKQALERVESIFRAKPEKGRITKTGRATLKSGLLCEYTEEGRTLLADMPEPLGGEGKAFSPGGYLRAALATCLAIGYAMRAAHRGVPVHKIEVDIECKTDLGSLCGLAGIPAGYTDLRYSVRIESDAAEADVMALIEEADARSPVLDAFRKAKGIVRSVALSRPETV